MLRAALKSTNMFWRAVLPGVNPAFVERLELNPGPKPMQRKRIVSFLYCRGCLTAPRVHT
jgi:hypothetical protein